MFFVLNRFDQVPYRENLTDYKLAPITLKGSDAIDFIVSELTAIMNDLPATGAAYRANQNAAHALLMKVYLNKGVYANRAAPTFDAGDMGKVISEAALITGYSLNDVFYDNFSPDNDIKSTENIFTLYNKNGDRGGNVQGTSFQVNHYNMNPAGWNGLATLSDCYNKFESGDQRIGMYYAYPARLPNP